METLDKRIVEINGVKLEVDMRQGKVTNVESYRVGQNVKLLIKQYSDTYKSCPGVIVGFDPFEKMPTVVIAYIEDGYSSEIKFAYLNSASKDLEVCPMNHLETVINRNLVVQKLDKNIDAKERELVELREKRAYFLDVFQQYFSGGEGKSDAVSTGHHA